MRFTLLTRIMRAALLCRVALSALPDCPPGCQCGGDESEASVVQRECVSVATCPCGLNMQQGQFAPEGVDGFDCVFFKMPVGHKPNPKIKADNEWLRGLPSSARRIDLAGCGIQVIDDGAFGHLKDTRVLNLEYNALTEIPHEAFKGMANLKVLWLTGHYLERAKLSAEALPEYEALTPVKNEIDTIHGTAFAHNPRLAILLLNHNNLSTLPESVFRPLRSSLRVLKLAGNPALERGGFQAALAGLDAVKQLDLNQDTGDTLEDMLQAEGHYLDDNNGDEFHWWASRAAEFQSRGRRGSLILPEKEESASAAASPAAEAWDEPFDL